MSQSLDEILALVGTLDDSSGKDTPRERFRNYLNARIGETGRIRDYVEECLRKKGDQYNKALQDLVNHIGTLMGFEVTYGRYRGVQNEIGFDGYWKSPMGEIHFVVEVKDPDGVTCGRGWITDQPGFFKFIAVYQDDPTTSEDEGAVNPDKIKFFINGVPALTAKFAANK